MNLPSCAVISLVITIVGALVLFNPKDYHLPSNQTGYSPVQPIAFSHKIHAKDNGIPCEYCHFSARRGPAAGIPPVNVCMNCHSEVKGSTPEAKKDIGKIYESIKSKRPIEWIRVHDCPDFVRFNHSAHVSKGVPCQQCHGPVEEMVRIEQTRHLNMGWCVNCHRDVTKKPLQGMEDVKASVECSTCHY